LLLLYGITELGTPVMILTTSKSEGPPNKSEGSPSTSSPWKKLPEKAWVQAVTERG
jgi:hypothetical protein